MKNRVVRIAMLCLMVAVFITAQTSVLASQVNLDALAKIEIKLLLLNSHTPQANVVVGIYKVGSMSENGECTLVAEFADSEVDLNEIPTMDASANGKAAKLLHTHARKNQIAYTGTGTTDADGTVVFSDLKVGSYLIVLADKNGKKIEMNPFLLNLPYSFDDTGDLYHVIAKPKVHKVTTTDRPDPRPPRPHRPDPKIPDGKLPQTGTLNWPIPVLTVLGLVFLTAGGLIIKGQKKKDEE